MWAQLGGWSWNRTSCTMMVLTTVFVSRSKTLTYPSWHPAYIVSPFPTIAKTAPRLQTNSCATVGIGESQSHIYNDVNTLSKKHLPKCYLDCFVTASCGQTNSTFVVFKNGHTVNVSIMRRINDVWNRNFQMFSWMRREVRIWSRAASTRDFWSAIIGVKISRSALVLRIAIEEFVCFSRRKRSSRCR